MKVIADKIKEIRQMNNYSQTDFGKLLNVSQDTVSMWERGKISPTIEHIYHICLTFEVSADYLLGLKV